MLTVNIESHFDPEPLERAVHHFERAVADEPKPRYRRALAEAYIASGRHRDALRILREVGDFREEPRVAFLSAYAAWKSGELELAEQYTRAAIAPGACGFHRVHVLRGRILIGLERVEEGAAELDRALASSPDDGPTRWHLATALVCLAERREGESQDLHRRAQALLWDGPESSDEWRLLMGRISLALGRPYEARDYLEKIDAFDSILERDLYRGLAKLLRGARLDALGYLEAAVARPRGRSRCASHLAEIAAAPVAPTAFAPARRTGRDLASELDFLEGVFGVAAPEITAILSASRAVHQVSATPTVVQPRTRREVAPTRRLDLSELEADVTDSVASLEEREAGAG